MTNFDSINDTFDVDGNLVPIEPTEIEIAEDTPKKDSSDQVNKDYEYTRGNLYSLIEKGQEAVNGILELAQESESPRAYEVAGQLIKNVADATDKLIDLQKKMKELGEDKSGPTHVTNNALFVGSTAELQKMLKQSMKSMDK